MLDCSAASKIRKNW